MRTILSIIICITLCLSTSSCVWFFAKEKGAIGLGKVSIEYYADGKTIKKKTVETKSLLENIFGLGSLFNK